ncbi:MAG: hypothetical protein II077_13795, partial [Treponema sp.]|nr:hypothetical protein [Treponema sp.]
MKITLKSKKNFQTIYLPPCPKRVESKCGFSRIVMQKYVKKALEWKCFRVSICIYQFSLRFAL